MKLNPSMSLSNKIGSTTTVNEQVDEFEVHIHIILGKPLSL